MRATAGAPWCLPAPEPKVLHMLQEMDVHLQNPETLNLEPSTLDPRPYRGTSLIRNRLILGPCSLDMPRPLWWS